MFKILDLAQKLEREGKKILHFELGEPDFDTPSNIVDAACNAIKSGDTHYTSSMGLYDFRVVAQKTTLQSRGFLPTLEQVLVAPGANSIIYFAIKCLVNPGEEVIVPDPGFPTYFSAIKACGAKAVTVKVKEENQFRLDPID
jgi:aspartate/methionine/tyrosine aminotransferase